MNKRKVIYIILLTVLIVIVGFLYNAFNGNPVSKWLAKNNLQQYLETNYPDQSYRVKEGFYDFKFSSYEFDVIEIGNTTEKGELVKYDFTLRGLNPVVVFDDIRYQHLDTELIERLEQEAVQELKNLLGTKLSNVEEITVQFEVVKGQLPEDTSWSRQLPLDKPIYIYIKLDATGASKEDIWNAGQMIQTSLNSEGYIYQSVNLNANMSSGALKYSLSILPDSTLTPGDVKEWNQ